MIVFFKRWAHLFFGLVAGAAIVYVDNNAFAGEVSPIIIVAMLLAATTAAGAIWERQRVAAAIVAWVCVPMAHFIKHVLRLPDTLHPNTYASIVYVAVFTLVVAAVGLGVGMLIRRLTIGPANGASQRV